jgi:hypothetical protein
MWRSPLVNALSVREGDMTDIPTRIALPSCLYPLIRSLDDGPKWFGGIMDFAQSRPVGEFASLQRCLDRMGELVSQSREKDETGIYRDPAPYSFGFSACGMVGACIYHGNAEGLPTFSVNVNGSDGWSIHT